ncbi:acyl carrier protein [Kitasatospora sp. MAP12-15]|uniref:acyl carrier protein n=1 Tax=unclassified Kitasatospora TaxID=2633591 RepID=UPI00247458A5|nr:acyl carrier protein [Kitasatospora sp. MAP12-44]MDH6111054.1 acyl carrier protein [Kitasatospora sp. MAP12-44]
MTRYDVSQVVRVAVEETFGLRPGEYCPDTALLGELGVDSLSLLDLMFRVECSLPVLLSPRWCAEQLQGPVPDGEFCDERGRITRRGLLQLGRVMPQIVPEEWSEGRLTLDRMLLFLTVGNLVAMIESALGAEHCVSHA